ncbi:MAG: protein kinase [Planctomycetes bacterium]|nr:protein kinase [Planctomycetota bacterium]
MDSTDDLLAELFARPDAEWKSGLDDVCRRHPDRAADLRRRFAHLERCGIASPVPAREHGDPPRRLGPYRLVRRLGDGGMGTVWLAQDEALGREVAIKTIRPERLWFDKARERFQREIEAVARLRHPGCVQIHQVGAADGVPWFAMEYVAGANAQQIIEALRERLATTPIAHLGGQDLAAVLRQGDPPLASASSELFAEPWVRVALRIVLGAAEALAHAHTRGVVHRDLKPSNLMVTPEGRVVVIDFGLAVAAGTSSLTGMGSQLGSVPYMAPEQLRGDAASIGVRTDVRALGLCLCELLTLQPTFAAKDEPMLRSAILDGTRADVRSANPAVGRDLEVVIARALHVDPEQRYASALDFAADLAAVLDDRPVQARRDALGARLSRWMRRRPAVATASGLLLLGVLVVPTIVTFAIADERDRARAAESEARLREYVANVSAAGTALRTGNVGEARLRLAACAPEQRAFEWRHLALGLDDSFLVVNTGPGTVGAIAVSGDGERIATGRDDGRIVVVDRASGRIVREWQIGSGPIAALGFDPSGREVFAVDQAQSLHVFDATSGALLRQRSRGDAAETLRLPTPVDRVFVGRGAGRITTIDPGTFATRHDVGLQLRDWPGDGGFRVADDALAAGAANGFTVWNLGDGSVRAEFANPVTMAVLGVTDEPLTVTAIDGHGLVVWSPERSTATFALGGRQPLTALPLRRGRFVVVPCNTGEILVLDPTARTARTLCGHRGAVTAAAIVPGSTSFVTGGADGTVRTWSAVATPRETELTGVGWGRSLAVDANGRLYTGGDDAQIRCLAPDSGSQEWGRGHPHWVNALAVVERDALLVASVGKTLFFGSRENVTALGRLELPASAGIGARIAVAPDERILAIAGSAGFVTIVDPVARTVLHHERVHTESVVDVAFVAPRTLLSAGADGTVHRIDVTNTFDDRLLVRTTGACRAMTIDRDVLYTSEQALDATTGLVCARDIRTGERLASCAVGDAVIVMRALDERRLVVGTHSGHIGFWNRAPLAPVLDVPCFEQRVRNLAVAPNGEWVAAIGAGGEPRILHTAPPRNGRDREQVADLRDRIRASLTELAWSPHAEAAIAGDPDLDDAARRRATALVPPPNRWSLGVLANQLAASPSPDETHLARLRALVPALDAAFTRDVDDHGKLLRIGRALVAVRLGDAAGALALLAGTTADATQGPDGDDGHFAPTLHFTRGMAHVLQHDTAAARREHDALATLVAGAYRDDARARLFLRELDEVLR